MTRIWLSLLIVGGLAACSPEVEAPPANEIAANVAVPTAPAAPAASDTPAASEPLLTLAPDGVALVDPNSGSSRALAFGVERALVANAALLARGTAEEGVNPECGAGSLEFARYPGGLTLWFQEGRFAGWALADDAAADLATASGLRVGSTRAELEAAYAATVEQTTLGQEFSAGEMSGLLDGPGPGARVTALWAGVSCIFR